MSGGDLDVDDEGLIEVGGEVGAAVHSVTQMWGDWAKATASAADGSQS